MTDTSLVPAPIPKPDTSHGAPMYTLDLGLDAFLNQHPEYAWLLTDPDLVGILERFQTDFSAGHTWTPDYWASQLAATKWGQTHNQYQQAWIRMAPADQKSALDAQTLIIRNSSVSLGFGLTDAVQGQLALEAQYNHWTPEQTQQAIIAAGNAAQGLGATPAGTEIDIATGRRAYYGPHNEPGGPSPTGKAGETSYRQPDGTTVYYVPGQMAYADKTRAPSQPGATPVTTAQPGSIGVTVDRLRTDALSYLPANMISDATLNQWSQQIALGRQSEDNFLNYLKVQAKSMFPTMAQAIDEGQTTAQYVDPYKNLIASTLNLAPDSVNVLSDPRYSKFLTQIDPKTGGRTVMSLDAAAQELKSNPIYGYQYTQGAKTQAYDLTSTLLQGLGAIK